MAATEAHADHTWDQRPPYAYPVDGEASFEKKLEGNCQCGRVRYWLKRDRPLTAKFCHCRGCQLLHGTESAMLSILGGCGLTCSIGAPFQWAAIFHKDDMVFENGTKDLVFYHSGEKTLGHDLPCKISCAHCRSPIMDEGRRMVLLFPTLLKFKDKAARDLFYPQYVL